MKIDIIDLKETVSFEEAAKWLSKNLDANVSISDLLGFALDGKIKISVQLFHRALVDVYDFVCSEKDIERHPDKLFRDKKAWDSLLLKIEKKIKMDSDDGLANDVPDDGLANEIPDDPLDPRYFKGLVIQGSAYAPQYADNKPEINRQWVGDCVLDLGMVGGGQIEIMRLYNEEKQYSKIELYNIDIGLVLLSLGGDRAYRVFYQYGDTTIPASSVQEIDHADYVIRTDELKRFYAEVTGENKPLDPREKDTYLKIIQAFCMENNINISERGARKRIELICDNAGLSISETTAKKLIKDLKAFSQ